MRALIARKHFLFFFFVSKLKLIDQKEAVVSFLAPQLAPPTPFSTSLLISRPPEVSALIISVLEGISALP
jgi:hypothetical protein